MKLFSCNASEFSSGKCLYIGPPDWLKKAYCDRCYSRKVSLISIISQKFCKRSTLQCTIRPFGQKQVFGASFCVFWNLQELCASISTELSLFVACPKRKQHIHHYDCCCCWGNELSGKDILFYCSSPPPQLIYLLWKYWIKRYRWWLVLFFGLLCSFNAEDPQSFLVIWQSDDNVHTSPWLLLNCVTPPLYSFEENMIHLWRTNVSFWWSGNKSYTCGTSVFFLGGGYPCG